MLLVLVGATLMHIEKSRRSADVLAYNKMGKPPERRQCLDQIAAWKTPSATFFTAWRSSEITGYRPQLSGLYGLLVRLRVHSQCWAEEERSRARGRTADGLPARWRRARGALQAYSVVMSPPSFKQYFGCGEAVEDFAIQQLVAKRPAKAFIVSVPPRRFPRDIVCGYAYPCQLFLDGRFDKFAAGVRPDIRRRPSRDEQLC